MAQDNGKLIIGAIIIVGLIIGGVQFGLFAVVEPGFTAIGESSTSLTDYEVKTSKICGTVCNTDYGVCTIPYTYGYESGLLGWGNIFSSGSCAHLIPIFEDSKYWNIKYYSTSTDPITEQSQAETFIDTYITTAGKKLKGSDRELDIRGSQSFSFKRDLKGRHFKIDFQYQCTNCPMTGSGGIGYNFLLKSKNGNSYDLGYIGVAESDNQIRKGGIELIPFEDPETGGYSTYIYFMGAFKEIIDMTNWDEIYLTGNPGTPGAGNMNILLINPRETVSLDTDGDGLTDVIEAQIGTNPNQVDTDLDELTDFEEINTYLTDPLKADTDNDGINDYEEINTYLTDPLISDTDLDGLTDGEEVICGTDEYITNPLVLDTDDDGSNDFIDSEPSEEPCTTTTCGNGVCESGEDETSCSEDCIEDTTIIIDDIINETTTDIVNETIVTDIVDEEEEKPWIIKYLPLLIIGAFLVLYFAGRRKIIKYSRGNRFTRWLYKYRKLGGLGFFGLILLSYYVWNPGLFILELFSVDTTSGLILFVSYLISSISGYLIGGFIQDFFNLKI